MLTNHSSLKYVFSCEKIQIRHDSPQSVQQEKEEEKKKKMKMKTDFS